MDNEKLKSWLDKTLQVLMVVFAVCWTILKWIFVFYAFLFGTIFWLLDLWLGDGRNPVRPPWDKPRPQFNPTQFRQDLQNATVEDVLKQFGKELEESDRKNQLQPEEKQVVRKLRGLDRSAFRSQLRESLSDEEIEILFFVILKLLGIEFR